MKILRTPDHCFDNLNGYDFKPSYASIVDQAGNSLRIHYLDLGAADAPTVLLMHGEPSWSYLYRRMIPALLDAGLRVVAPDLIGFGRSDKPADRSDYTYQRHVSWMTRWLEHCNLQNLTLFCQDWGGLIGLRLLAEQTQRFNGAIAANTFLPTGDVAASEAFLKWQQFSQSVPEFPTSKIIDGATETELSDDIKRGYDAPYPDESYKAGARQFPMLVPISPDDPAADANRAAWEVLKQLTLPFLTAFSDKDPITRGGDKVFQTLIPGAQGQRHLTVENVGHFLQEDKAEQLAAVVTEFIEFNGLAEPNND